MTVLFPFWDIKRGGTIRYDFFCFFLGSIFSFFFFFFRESFASFTRGTRGIPCKVQRRSWICEVSEAKSRGEWSRKELSDCRHLRDGLSLINGSNIPPYTDDPGIGDTILVIYKHRSPVCVCVYVYVVDVSAFTASGTDASKNFLS